MPRLTQKSVDALTQSDREFTVWGTEVSGFDVRVRPTGAKTFMLFYRLGGKLRKHTMGKPAIGYGVAEARERATAPFAGTARRHRPATGEGR